MTVIWIIVAVIAVVLLAAVWAFNGLVRRRNTTKEAWSQIDVELKRRHDLIPNLVGTVKGYAAHESGTFEAVTRARAAAVSAGATADPAHMVPAENALSASLRSLFAVAENYPALRAVESFKAVAGRSASFLSFRQQQAGSSTRASAPRASRTGE